MKLKPTRPLLAALLPLSLAMLLGACDRPAPEVPPAPADSTPAPPPVPEPQPTTPPSQPASPASY